MGKLNYLCTANFLPAGKSLLRVDTVEKDFSGDRSNFLRGTGAVVRK
jgi:hypothetical protein